MQKIGLVQLIIPLADLPLDLFHRWAFYSEGVLINIMTESKLLGTKQRGDDFFFINIHISFQSFACM